MRDANFQSVTFSAFILTFASLHFSDFWICIILLIPQQLILQLTHSQPAQRRKPCTTP